MVGLAGKKARKRQTLTSDARSRALLFNLMYTEVGEDLLLPRMGVARCCEQTSMRAHLQASSSQQSTTSKKTEGCCEHRARGTGEAIGTGSFDREVEWLRRGVRRGVPLMTPFRASGGRSRTFWKAWKGRKPCKSEGAEHRLLTRQRRRQFSAAGVTRLERNRKDGIATDGVS